MAEDNLQYDTEQPEIQVDDHPEQEQQGPGDPPSKVLWEKMVKNKRYSFSYDDFQKEYNSKEAVAQLHKELRGVGAKVVPINDFYAKYFPDLAGAKSSTTKPAQNEKPTAAGAQQQPVTSQTPKLAPQVFEKPITSQQYAPMDGIPAYGSPEYKKIKAAEAEKQSKQVAQQRAFQEFETAYDKFNIAKKNVDNGNDPDEQGVLSNGKPYSKAIGGKGVIENVSDFIIGHIVPSEAVKQEQERSRMQSKLLSYSSANEKALKTAQVYIDDITNEALKGYTRLSKISSVDGVHTPDPIKIRQYINNRAESAGFSKDGPVYDILNSKITTGVEYAIKKPTIEKNANEISKKETGKSIQELVSAEQQAIIQSAADINSKAKLQAETLAQKTISANKAEAQDLFNTKYKPLYDERNAISEQAASAFEKQFAHLIKDGKFIGSPQEYEMYNQQLAALQAIDDENKALTDSWSKELFKEQGRIASKYNKQYMAGISALEASTKKELAKKNEELKAFKVSPGLLTKINRYYEEAYKKTVTDEDAAKAPKGFLQTLSAFDSMFTHNFLDAMANYAGRMGLKGIESVFAAGANEFNPQQIEMNKFSDFLIPYKVIGSGATMGGRMGPAIAAGAITGALTKNTGMAFRAFMAGANEWLTENTDNAHSTYKDVLAETGDPVKAENAAHKQYEAGIINLPLYGLGWMPFFSKSFNKLPLAAKIVAGTAIETGTELPTEFSQTLQEESIKETGDWKNMLDYATWEKAKNTFYNIVPLSLTMGGGGHVVTHFADKVTYNQKVDALVQATEIGGASASQQDQYAFNLVKIGDTKLAKAVLVGLHQSGHITDKELNRLNATVDKAKSITESAEKLGMNEGEQRIYAALNYQFEEAKANMATEKDPIAREAWKLKAANAQQNITNFAATKQGDYAIVTYADGGQSVFSHEEINNALSTLVVAKSLAKGTLKIEVFGKEKEALAEKIKQTTEAEKKSTTGTSVTDDETENGNDDFSVEKVEAADGITHYLPTSSTSGYFKDEQGEDISFTTEQEAKDFLSKQPKAQVPTLSTQSKKETLTKEQDEAKQRVATFIDNTVLLPTTDATLREKLGNDPKAALQELIDFHEQQKSGKDEKTQVFHQKAIDKFEALKNDIDLINQQPQKSAETQKHDGSKSKDVESAIDGGKSQQPGQLQQNEVEIPNTPEASQLDEERKKAIAPLQAVAGGKATHTIQLPQRGKNTATILQNGREAGSIILTPEEQSLNDQKEAGREAGLVTDEEYNEWHKGFTAKVAARAIDATNKQYAKKQEALVNNPPSFLQRVKNLDLEAITDPIGRVLKYFALGGKINTNFVKEQYGGKDERIRQSTSTEEQRRSMFSLLAKDAPNIEELAEQLEAEANQHNDGNSRLDTRDYVSAIEEVLSSHQSPASAAKELWEKYSPEATEAEIAKLWEQKGGSQTQEESAPLEETEVWQLLTINGEEISFSADNSNPQTASQEPKLLTPNDPKFKRLQKAINRFLSKIKGYSTEVLHGQDFQKLVDWAKRQQDVKMMAGRKPVGGNSGYVGYSMSRRAAQAYDDGKAQERYDKAKEEYLNSDAAKADEQKFNEGKQKAQDITDNVKQIFETEESDKEPKYFRRPNGTIYGIKVGTKIYLNGDKLNLETPAHEAGHIFRDWAKENAPDLYKAATKLMSRPNKYREMVLANETYKEQIRQMKANGATAEQINEFIADEALAHMIGDRAAKIVENRSQFVQWLKDLWESIKLSMPGAKDFENKTLSDFYKMTWDQFGNAATERILSGRALAQEGQPLFMKNKGLTPMQMSTLGKSDFDKDGNVKPKVAEAIKKEYADIEAKAKADGTWMKAPNGKPSNLNEMQWVQVRSSRFKKWFGDWENDPQNASKVVDSNGEPLVVYHGSPNGVFTVFDLSKRGTRSTGAYNESRALHFTDNLKTAIAYSESYKNKPVKYTVNGVEKIINPTDTRPSAKEYEVFLNIRNAEDVGASRNITKEKITDAIKSGFDGIFADMGNGREFVAFNPNQIKSATSNAGTFSNETGDIRFMASGISNSNTNFIEDEKTKYYTTSEGEKIPYRVYDTGSKKDGNNASTNLLQRQENTEQGNDFALVERQFTEYKQLDFTAGTKIESLNDVAWLFHNLEDESVEHSFAVYIMPNGSYVVQHLSTGGIASTVIDGRLVSGNAVKMGAKSVAFVHNHPSGALRASNADMHVYSKLKKSLEGTGIDLQDGVIINLKSGKYVTFDAQSNAVNDITKQNQAQHKVQVLSFSKQVFAENYNPDKITGYSDVAMLLSTKKFGVSDKTEMLVLNNALEVVGKFVLPENNQYAKIIELLTQYGGVNAILYGNKINAEEVNDYNRRLVSIGFKISDAIEVKSDNYKSLVSEGLINEDQPLYESNSPSNTDNHEAAKKKTQGNRIEVSPLPVGKRKEIRHIIRDFKNAAKTRIFYTKVGRRAAGTYNSSEGAIRLRYAGDLDTTAHEAGHDIDDRYKVIEAILKNPAARAELVPFVASPAASKPPKGHPNPQNYLQREGFAEWLRAFIVNPDEAKAQAPEIYKIYEAQVHDNMKKAVHHFSNDVRTFAGLEGIDQLLSNVELTPETKSFFDRFKDKNHEGVFYISWVDKIKINMLNSLQAFDKAWNIAKGLKGIDEVLPENDPTILVRLLYGFDGKFGAILETGMINSKNEVLEDANGNAKNLDWLLEPLDRYNEKTIKKEQEYTIAFMVAERTLELSKRFGRESILSGIGGGLFKDIETAQAALDEINALPPAQKARIEEAARRYREFANDILLYMVDKGRLSQEQYDAIKKENVQYVAMQRIIDQEPGTELEVFTMNGNSIGSVAKPVHNIQGSSRTIINPYSSLLDGLYRSIKEADRNEILVAFTDMVSHVRSMGDGEVIPFSDIAIKGKPGDKNTQVVYRNGKPEYWKFQQDIHEAIKGLNEEAEGLLMKYGKIPGTILRETITKFPVFAARNFIRDTQDRIIKSSDSNLLDLVGNSAHWKDIARFGGLNSGFYMRDRASYYGLMKESMKRLAKNKNTIVLSGEGMKRVWDRYEKALQTSETINRVAEYRGAFREAKKKGMDDYNAALYAASRARNLIDFAEAGVIMRQLNKLIPFSNAAVQGMRSAVNRAIEDPGGFAIRTGVYSVLPAVMLWMWNHRKDDDDDKENEYENLPAYQRDMYHNLKIGKNKWLSIPKPYELSLVSSGIDRGMSLFFGKNKNAFQGYGGTVIQSVMPLDESSMFGPFRPIYEGISNYDVFRQKNIVPTYENDLDLSLRHTETASLLGQWLQSASNIDARKIDHFIQGQFGYFGKAAMKLSNINREDGGRSFDITDLGFFKESPGYNSPDVQNLLNYAKRWGLTQNIDFKDIKALNQAIFDAKTDEEKEAAKKELITHSRLLLLQWKAEDKAKQKQDKFTEKQDTKSD